MLRTPPDPFTFQHWNGNEDEPHLPSHRYPRYLQGSGGSSGGSSGGGSWGGGSYGTRYGYGNRYGYGYGRGYGGGCSGQGCVIGIVICVVLVLGVVLYYCVRLGGERKRNTNMDFGTQESFLSGKVNARGKVISARTAVDNEEGAATREMDVIVQKDTEGQKFGVRLKGDGGTEPTVVTWLSGDSVLAGHIKVGDKLVSVNKEAVVGGSTDACEKLKDAPVGNVVLTIVRSAPPCFLPGTYTGRYHQYGNVEGMEPFTIDWAAGFNTITGQGSDAIGDYYLTGKWVGDRLAMTKNYRLGTGDPKENFGHKVYIRLERDSNMMRGMYYVRTERFRGEGEWDIWRTGGDDATAPTTFANTVMNFFNPPAVQADAVPVPMATATVIEPTIATASAPPTEEDDYKVGPGIYAHPVGFSAQAVAYHSTRTLLAPIRRSFSSRRSIAPQMEIDVEVEKETPEQKFGIRVKGTGIEPKITSIPEHGLLAGKVKVGDRLVSVNGDTVVGGAADACRKLNNAPVGSIILTIVRSVPPPSATTLEREMDVIAQKDTEGQKFGIRLKGDGTEPTVTWLSGDSALAGQVKVGDKLVSVNKETVLGGSTDACKKLKDAPVGNIVLTIVRSVSPP